MKKGEAPNAITLCKRGSFQPQLLYPQADLRPLSQQEPEHEDAGHHLGQHRGQSRSGDPHAEHKT